MTTHGARTAAVWLALATLSVLTWILVGVTLAGLFGHLW